MVRFRQGRGHGLHLAVDLGYGDDAGELVYGPLHASGAHRVRRRLDLDGRFRNGSASSAHRLDAHDELSSAAASRLRESEAAAIAPARTLPVRRATVRQDRMARQDRLNGTLAGLVGFAHAACAGLFPFGALGTGGLPGNAANRGLTVARG